MGGKKLNFYENKISYGHPQPRVWKSQEVSGMGRLEIFFSKSKKNRRRGGDGFHHAPNLIRLKLGMRTRIRFFIEQNISQNQQIQA